MWLAGAKSNLTHHHGPEEAKQGGGYVRPPFMEHPLCANQALCQELKKLFTFSPAVESGEGRLPVFCCVVLDVSAVFNLKKS